MASPERPGANRPAGTRPADYNRAALTHLLAVYPWQGWEDMLGWLRSEAPNDPFLNPDQYRAIRQDAERAHRTGARFSNDPDDLWAELRRHHTPVD